MKLQFTLCFLLCFASVFSQEYEVKPDWWDKVQISLEKGSNIYDTITKTEAKYLKESNCKEIKDWYLLGPFSDYGQSPFERKYPPEEKIDLGAKYPGSEGEISWKEYVYKERFGDNQPKPTNCVFFFYKEFKEDIPDAKFISVIHDDGAQIFLNGKQIYKNPNYSGGDTLENASSIQASIKKGDKILVKLQQGWGDWGFKLFVTDIPTDFIRIKILTLAFLQHSDAPLNEKLIFSDRISWLYEKNNDFKNLLYWRKKKPFIIRKKYLY